jgi:hypothetical protein
MGKRKNLTHRILPNDKICKIRKLFFDPPSKILQQVGNLHPGFALQAFSAETRLVRLRNGFFDPTPLIRRWPGQFAL